MARRPIGRLGRILIGGAASCAALGGGVFAASEAAAAGSTSPCSGDICATTFTTDADSVQTWTPPPGVSVATVTVDGAAGGAYDIVPGGEGAQAQAILPQLSTTSTLSISVGGAGQQGTLYTYPDPQATTPSAGGLFGGGEGADGAGGGGGESEIAQGGEPLVVAGGGGGAGEVETIPTTATDGAGGAGGPSGAAGATGASDGIGRAEGGGGAGATPTSPGAGGSVGPDCPGGGASAATDGSAGQGGAGGQTLTVGTTVPFDGGGGGGGGVYGGGGGASSCAEGGGGGGGGGSSEIMTSSEVEAGPVVSGARSGDGEVVISYTQPSMTGVTTSPPTTTTSSTTVTTISTATTAPTVTATTAATPPALSHTRVSSPTLTWCFGRGCRYPATDLTYTLNRPTVLRALLRARPGGRWKTVATARLHGHAGRNRDRIAGRWHGQLVPARTVELVLQAPVDGGWHTVSILRLTVRHRHIRKTP